MPTFEFARLLKAEIEARLLTKDREWSIKGFIDASKKIYPLSLDTKLLSKVLELTVIPLVQVFAEKHKLRMYLEIGRASCRARV